MFATRPITGAGFDAPQLKSMVKIVVYLVCVSSFLLVNETPAMTQAEATAQVDSAVQTLGEGMIRGDVELALKGCDTNDADWLAAQRLVVEEVHAKLTGHPATLFHTWGYTAPGSPHEVTTYVYGGVLAVYDSLAREIIHAEPYRAQFQEGRFRLLPPPTDRISQINFRQDLGGIYQRELGMGEKALEIWTQVLEELPEEDTRRRMQAYVGIAAVHEEQKDYATAYATYEKGLKLMKKGHSYGAIEIAGKQVVVNQQEGVMYKMARCALAAGWADKTRALCERLAHSPSEELVSAANQMMAKLKTD